MKRILILQRDRQTLEKILQTIPSEKASIQTVEDEDAALRRLRAWKPHVFIIGVQSTEQDADKNPPSMEILTKIRAVVSEEYSSILIISESLNPETISKMMDMGADGFLSSSFEPGEFWAVLLSMIKFKDLKDSLRRASHRIEELASTDDLTGVMNMRAAYRRGEEALLHARRTGKQVSACMLNVDGFSVVNQSYGFMVGSRILQELGKRIHQTIRSSDFVARVGADEFFIFFPDTDLASAEKLSEKIKEAIQFVPFKSDQYSIKLTATMGIAGLGTDKIQQKMGDLLHLASEALRSARNGG